jgi:hypothetical protein
MSNQTAQSAFDATGRAKRVSIERTVDDDGNERVDVELVLEKQPNANSPEVRVKFIGARDIRVGDGHGGVDLGAYFLLSVWDVSRDGWDGVRFRAANLEQGCPFSLYCRTFECSPV